MKERMNKKKLYSYLVSGTCARATQCFAVEFNEIILKGDSKAHPYIIASADDVETMTVSETLVQLHI